MRRIVWLLLTAVAWVPAGDRLAWAQEPSPSLRLELKLTRKPPVVPPVPDPEIVKRDAARAITEFEARERDERAMRQAIPSPPRRPDLNYDVWSGIQSRSLTDALRRR